MNEKTNYCPTCGTINPHETQQCPMRDGQPVCVECCKLCEHHKSIYRCGYVREDPTAELRQAIGKINMEIYRKEKLISWFYRKNLPRRAQQIEAEIRGLMIKRKEIEHAFRSKEPLPAVEAAGEDERG